MTLDEIDARIRELKAQQRQHLDNASACQGAIEDCLHWRAALEKEQQEKQQGGHQGESKPAKKAKSG